jgi:hypothetical protein
LGSLREEGQGEKHEGERKREGEREREREKDREREQGKRVVYFMLHTVVLMNTIQHSGCLSVCITLGLLDIKWS